MFDKDVANSLEKVIKDLQFFILEKLNPTIGEPDLKGAIPYIISIDIINAHFDTKYQSINLCKNKINFFDGIYKQLPWRD